MLDKDGNRQWLLDISVNAREMDEVVRINIRNTFGASGLREHALTSLNWLTLSARGQKDNDIVG